MTIIVEYPDAVPAPNAPIITLPTPQEQALIRLQSMRAWFRPSLGYATPGAWVDNKSSIRANLRRSIWPNVRFDSNGLPYLPQESGPLTSVWVGQDPAPIIPSSGDFTLVWVAMLQAGSRTTSQAVLGNAMDDNTKATWAGYGAGSETMMFRSGGFTHITHTAGAALSDLHFVMLSYDSAAGNSSMYLNGSVVGTQTTPTSPQNTNLAICGSMQASGGSVTNTAFKGRLYDAMVLHSAVHKPTASNVLATVLAYMFDRYGLAA